jgi:nanoRNase/pAp phosphatase (c-di-AMP/oligoRNAs hydrolase)
MTTNTDTRRYIEYAGVHNEYPQEDPQQIVVHEGPDADALTVALVGVLKGFYQVRVRTRTVETTDESTPWSTDVAPDPEP